MGGISKFLMLLSTPFPLLPGPSSSAALRLARRSSSALSTSGAARFFHHPKTKTPFKYHQLHTQTLAQRDGQGGDSVVVANSAPFSRGFDSAGVSWPEWAKLVENLSEGGYFGRGGRGVDDEFEVVGTMPEEFVRAAEACLAFARERPDVLRLLSKKNIEVVVNGGSPSLFKSSASSARRMMSFLTGGESNVLESERAQTVDVMRYMLSYAYDSLSNPEGVKDKDVELVESSFRSLLSEFVNMSGVIQGSNFTDSTPRQAAVNYEQFSRPPVQNIEMKRGDWTCPKCSFMNFARNSKCLECDEARPKRQLTGAEWECPQCDFYNYGRNMSCLRCDCKRPAELSSTSPSGKSSILDQILSGSNTNKDKSELEQNLAANDEKAERRFSKMSQLGDKTDMSSTIADEDFPEIMPLRKGTNRFDLSQRKTPLERRLANSQSDRPAESSINKSLDRILGRTSNSTEATEPSKFSSEQYRERIAKADPGHVPFVPLPPDMFSKPQNSNAEPQRKEDSNSASLIEILKDKDESSNLIPDENFPDIMPMRKGENRFVVSKKKDRSLTSPQYKRRLAMEQANKSEFVPFVPFPPGYFAKKDNQPETSPAANNETIAENSAPPENYSQSYNTQNSGNKLNENTESWNNARFASNSTTQETEKFQNSNQSWNRSNENMDWNRGRAAYDNTTQRTRENYAQPEKASTYNPSYNTQSSGNEWNKSQDSWNSGRIASSSTTQNSNQSWNKSNESKGSWNGGFSQTRTASNSSNLETQNFQSSSQSWNKSSYSGKSLEGSAVTEPDPLDMSEEAKAARWFRRAAQIKNISELSEIPDEDFPEIMPMRKGVNRFVVSKRKTPLERRLTSPQYRRNLPIVSSDPEKNSSSS